jgi:hypothetical protein
MSISQGRVSDLDLSVWEKVNFNETNEEKNTRIAEEKASTLDLMKRKKRLEHLVEKRKLNFQYIKDLHQGGTYFLNSVMVTREDVYRVVCQKDVEHRARMFYYLGLSLSALLDLTNGPATVRAFSQLMEEWEYTFDSAPAIQGTLVCT